MRLLSQIKASANPRIYNSNCLVNLPEMYSRIYPPPPQEEPIKLKVNRITIEDYEYFKTANGDIYDPKTKEFVGTYINGVFTKEETDDEESDDEESDEEESIPNVIEQNIIVDGVNYLVTTNADVQDETTKKFIDSLVSSEESSDEEDTLEEAFEEKESLLRILAACKIVSNEIVQLTSLLNNRLENL